MLHTSFLVVIPLQKMFEKGHLYYLRVTQSVRWSVNQGLVYLCLPHEMGRHIVFSSVVCPSVRPSVRAYRWALVGYQNT